MTAISTKNQALLKVDGLSVTFQLSRRSSIKAVSDVSFHIERGETLGLVGESGCGKTTIARSIVGLQKTSTGKIIYDGEDLTQCSGAKMQAIRPLIQMIFQDAIASLNPGRRVGKTIGEPLRVLRKIDLCERMKQARGMMRSVGLDPEGMFDRFPYEFSGGQCQRVSIARALILKPKLLVCDEPVSSLDVSVQAQILNLLEKMKRRFGLTMLFISHDLAVVKNISDRVAVMYLGKICEIAPAEDLYRSPRHPYSALLLASIPEPDPKKQPFQINTSNLELPSPSDPPPGCRFHTRCGKARKICSRTAPSLIELDGNRQVACHFPMGKDVHSPSVVRRPISPRFNANRHPT
jgi:peptide/nickel transport system ATP-binding protein